MKGSPYPRSYYKCSHAGCNVKKIVERDPKTGDVSSAIAKVRPAAQATTACSDCFHRPLHQGFGMIIAVMSCSECHMVWSMQGGHNHTKPNSRPSSGSMNTRGTGRAARGSRAARGRTGRVAASLAHLSMAAFALLHAAKPLIESVSDMLS